ncbi:Rapid alkalinization factor [Ananas comosus]|uniref:Rapid alkalinization factor n=1 Tax=Ananas comosus TaxID=4615 RepID=A0A199V4X9_ANACO|nr:Rapid alkalinization factor [Ananas comosus]
MRTLAHSILLLLLLLLLLLGASIAPISSATTSSGGGDLTWIAAAHGGGELDLGSDAAAAAAAEEEGARRRELWGWGGYIGYDALRRDSVPCSQRGASYYNCRPGAQGNPYSRRLLRHHPMPELMKP